MFVSAPPAFVFAASLRRDGERGGTVDLASRRLLLCVLAGPLTSLNGAPAD